jgi:predicted alpha/beta hydrolase
MSKRQLKAGFVLHGVGAGWGDWRHEAALTDGSVNFGFYREQAQLAEKAGFEFLFVADSVHITERSSPHYLNRFEPLTILSALAGATLISVWLPPLQPAIASRLRWRANWLR